MVTVPFLHRVDKVGVVAAHQYSDVDDDFERPPYSVLMRTKRIGNEATIVRIR